MGLLDWVLRQRESKRVGKLIKALHGPEKQARINAAVELGKHPGATTVAALLMALSDHDATVRGHAADSLSAIARTRLCKIHVKTILEILKTEPADSAAYASIVGLLSELGADVAARGVVEQKRGEGAIAATKVRQMNEVEDALGGQKSFADFESAFKSVFECLQDSDAEVRAAASQLLASSPQAVRKLSSIYAGTVFPSDRERALAGRVLGRKVSGGKPEVIPERTSMITYGILDPFVPCICAHCGKVNVGIPVPGRGQVTPFYAEKDNQEHPFAVPVLCDFCGAEFFVVWDSAGCAADWPVKLTK